MHFMMHLVRLLSLRKNLARMMRSEARSDKRIIVDEVLHDEKTRNYDCK